MIKFNIIDDLLNLDDLNIDNPIYIDTDSLFLTMPTSLENEEKLSQNYINLLQDEINDVYLRDFLYYHNIKIRDKEESPLLIADFKNEYMIKSMILYAKKRYISVIIKYKEDGSRYYDIDLKGVEGKRVTNKFVKNLVDDLIEYIKKLDNTNEIYTRYDLLYNIVKKYIDDIYTIDGLNIYDVLDYFSLPVNVGKQIINLKNVAGYYKGTINFDIVTGENYWDGKTGKGKWLAVRLKNEAFIPKILKQYEKYPAIKTENKKPYDLIKDVTIPDEYLQKNSEVVADLFNIFTLDYDYYTELLLKKIRLMYNPFDVMFCDNLLKKINNNSPQNFSIIGENYVFEKKIH